MITKTPPLPVAAKRLAAVPYGFAVLLAAMALLQLVNFEAFVQNIIAFTILPTELSTMLAVLLIAFEVFALPFLLRLWLSKLARACSAVLALLAPLSWLTIVTIGLLRGATGQNASLFGDFLPLTIGWGALIFALALSVLGIWSFVLLGGAKNVVFKG